MIGSRRLEPPTLVHTGRTFHGLDELNAQVRHWLATTANVRVHGTTGRRPVDLFAEEQATLAAYERCWPVGRSPSHLPG